MLFCALAVSGEALPSPPHPPKETIGHQPIRASPVKRCAHTSRSHFVEFLASPNSSRCHTIGSFVFSCFISSSVSNFSASRNNSIPSALLLLGCHGNNPSYSI